MTKSKSWKVNAYVKANLRHQKLRARLRAKEDALRPLKHAVEVSTRDCIERWAALTGGQAAEAQRILREIPITVG